MVTCRYCGVYSETFRSTCPSCGAPLQMEEEVPEKTAAQVPADKIRQVCDHHMNRDFKDGESIPDKRMDKFRNSFRIFPDGKDIFLYCDTTPFRTGGEGFLICEDGVYWQNSWTTPTNRNFINWETFKNRQITLYVIRPYDRLAERDEMEDAYYASGDWRQGPREAILALIENYTDIVFEADETTVQGLRR